MTPLFKVGDILHCVFRFTHNKAAGGDERVKTGPVMVAAANDQRVFTLAIARQGDASVSTLPIPDVVADAAGLARGTGVVIDQ